jgi:DNA processing protein
MKSNIISWIAISLIPELGPIKLAQLVEKHGSPYAVLKVKTNSSLRRELEHKAHEILSKVDKLGGFAISRDCPTYPQLLAAIPDAPPVLYIKGTLPDNLERAVAVVGTRRCTEDGAAKASEIARTLAQLGCPLISGLAKGIDAAAHRASLAHGVPSVAVLAHGLDRIYPLENRGLAQRLLENGGALLTEHPPETVVSRWMFASRNRILVGLCSATIMVQSPIKGGSLISARLALDYNRDTFAVVPLNGFSSVWAGNTELILNTEAQKLKDISSLPARLNFTVLPCSSLPSKSASDTEAQYVPEIPERCRGVYDEIVTHSVVTPARLSRSLKASIRVIRTRLFVLEVLGWVRRVPGDRYILH